MNALADWAVGQVYQTLERHNVLDDTLVIFTSDNGPQRGENGHSSAGPLRGFKNSAFEGGHRVPFIARWPGRVAEDDSNDCTFCLTDLIATFAELLEVDVPDDAAPDSVSFLPALLGDQQHRPRHAMINTTGGFWAGEADFALRMGKWKLIVTAAREDQPATRHLFDLETDLAETTNLIESKPKLAGEMDALLGRLKACGTKHLDWDAPAVGEVEAP